MLDALRFVKGAVARKDFIQALTHFQIRNKMIKGHNGQITICAPIDLDLDVMPHAVTFARALDTCKEAIAIHQTPGGRLSIRSGKFKVLVDCVQDGFPETHPEGDMIPLPNGQLLKVLKILRPFIAEDASRSWARGILLRGPSAFATNNVVLVEHWMGWEFPVEVNIPKTTIDELIRIGEEPSAIQVTENTITFHYPGDRWLKSTLFSLGWPDLTKVLGGSSDPQPVPEGLWDALNDVVPFVNKLRQVFLRDGAISTDPKDESGAVVEVPGLVASGIYNIDYLIELSEIISTVDLTGYPGPIKFFGAGTRGAVIGMRG